MAGFCDYLETKFLNTLGGQDTYSAASTYIALFSATPTDASGGTELSGNNYSRIKCGTWTSCTGGTIHNATTVTFGTATTAGWATVSVFAILNDSLTGNMLAYGSLSVVKEVGVGDIAQFGTGTLAVGLD